MVQPLLLLDVCHSWRSTHLSSSLRRSWNTNSSFTFSAAAMELTRCDSAISAVCRRGQKLLSVPMSTIHSSSSACMSMCSTPPSWATCKGATETRAGAGGGVCCCKRALPRVPGSGKQVHGADCTHSHTVWGHEAGWQCPVGTYVYKLPCKLSLLQPLSVTTVCTIRRVV